jgi:hypothetical protein
MSTPPSEFDYQYSIPVAVNGDFPSIFHPRINIAAGQADKACLECRNDLTTAGCRSIPEGCINPVSGNAIALWFPEALPERLGIIAYMNEFSFLDDGKLQVPLCY